MQPTLQFTWNLKNLRFYYIIIVTTHNDATFIKWLFQQISPRSFGWKTGLARLGLNRRGAASPFRSLSPDLFQLSLTLLPPPPPPPPFSGPFFLRSPAISNWATQFPSFASREKFSGLRQRCRRQITKPLTVFDALAVAAINSSNAVQQSRNAIKNGDIPILMLFLPVSYPFRKERTTVHY